MKPLLYQKLLTGILMICFYSCYSQTPIEVNNKLAKITDTLYDKGKSWGIEFNEAMKSREFSKLSVVRADMENYINSKINEVRKMKEVNGSGDMQKGMLDFLLFEKNMLHTGFLDFEKFSSSSTDAEIQSALDKLTTLSKQESGKLAEYQKLQEQYAKKNGFTIEKSN